MPLGIKVKDEQFCPVVVCDLCAQEIEDAERGNYEWRVSDGQPTDGHIYFTHKVCCRTFEETHGGRRRWQWRELAEFSTHLATTLNVSNMNMHFQATTQTFHDHRGQHRA